MDAKHYYKYPALQDGNASEAALPDITSPSIEDNNQPAREQLNLPIGIGYPNIINTPSPARDIGQEIMPSPFTNGTQGMGLPHLHAQGTQRSSLFRSEARSPTESPQTRVSPEARNIPRLFSHLFCASIVKTDRVASIRAIFGEPSQCRLEVDIYSAKIPQIAGKLFGVDIENEDERRLAMRFDTGASMLITTIELSGANRGGAERLLGPIFANIRSDALYMQELDRGESVTKVISLEINGNVQGQSCLKIQCTQQTLSFISTRLWPSSP